MAGTADKWDGSWVVYRTVDGVWTYIAEKQDPRSDVINMTDDLKKAARPGYDFAMIICKVANGPEDRGWRIARSDEMAESRLKSPGLAGMNFITDRERGSR